MDWAPVHGMEGEPRRREEKSGEDESDEDDTPVVIPSSGRQLVTMHTQRGPQCQHRPWLEVQVLSSARNESGSEHNDITWVLAGWRQMIGVGIRVLARGELDGTRGAKFRCEESGVTPRSERSRDARGREQGIGTTAGPARAGGRRAARRRRRRPSQNEASPRHAQRDPMPRCEATLSPIRLYEYPASK